MSKLKTLKDLKRIEDDHQILNIDEIEEYSGYGRTKEDVIKEGDKDSYASFYDLKQEAIRWIKVLEEDAKEIANNNVIPYHQGEQQIRCYEFQKKMELVSWIKNFFNITKEDLEGEKEE